MAEEKKPNWIKTKPAELEKIVVDLANSGVPPAKIGLILRDQHGIPKAKLLGKKISQILKDSKTPVREEKEIVSEKLENLKSHIGSNKHDYPAQRSLTKKLWILHNLEKKSN